MNIVLFILKNIMVIPCLFILGIVCKIFPNHEPFHYKMIDKIKKNTFFTGFTGM